MERNLPKRHRLRSDVRYRRVHDEAVVLLQEDGEVLVLNEVGAVMVQRLDRGESLEQIVQGLAEIYETGDEKLGKDVAEFVTELQSAGVVEEAQGLLDQSEGAFTRHATAEDFHKIPYVPPGILLRQGLEAVAATCVGPFAKADPIACPTGPISS